MREGQLLEKQEIDKMYAMLLYFPRLMLISWASVAISQQLLCRDDMTLSVLLVLPLHLRTLLT